MLLIFTCMNMSLLSLGTFPFMVFFQDLVYVIHLEIFSHIYAQVMGGLIPQFVLVFSIKKTRGHLLDRRCRWDFQVSRGKRDAGKGEGCFSAMLWNEKKTALM